MTLIDLNGLFRSAFCDKVRVSMLSGGAAQVTTPLLDWKGSPVSVFVDADGTVTDGGNTLSELRSLRVYDEWADWPFRADFLDRYALTEKDEELLAANPTEPAAVLRAVQGMSRLATYFESRPIAQRADVFPEIVKSKIENELVRVAPVAPDQREKFTRERLARKRWEHHGVPLFTDFTPLADRVMVQIISYSTATSSAKKSHISEKLLPYALLRGDPNYSNLMFFPILNAKEDYPLQSQKLLEAESKHIFEYRDSDNVKRIVKLLTSSSPLDATAP